MIGAAPELEQDDIGMMVVFRGSSAPAGAENATRFANVMSVDWQGSGLYDGEMEVNATCDSQRIGASGDVHLIADSGVDHAS